MLPVKIIPRGWALEAGVTALSVFAAAGIILWCGNIGLEYARQVPNLRCGVRYDPTEKLLLDVPLALVVAHLGWMSVCRPGTLKVARCAALAALTAWGTVLAFAWLT